LSNAIHSVPDEQKGSSKTNSLIDPTPLKLTPVVPVAGPVPNVADGATWSTADVFQRRDEQDIAIQARNVDTDATELDAETQEAVVVRSLPVQDEASGPTVIDDSKSANPIIMRDTVQDLDAASEPRTMQLQSRSDMVDAADAEEATPLTARSLVELDAAEATDDVSQDQQLRSRDLDTAEVNVVETDADQPIQARQWRQDSTEGTNGDAEEDKVSPALVSNRRMPRGSMGLSKRHGVEELVLPIHSFVHPVHPALVGHNSLVRPIGHNNIFVHGNLPVHPIGVHHY
jgi:hypothetical protein